MTGSGAPGHKHDRRTAVQPPGTPGRVVTAMSILTIAVAWNERLLRGMSTRSRGRGRASGVGSVNGPSRNGDGVSGKRRKRPSAALHPL